MATPPRKIDPGMIFYETVRCTNRSFRLVPKARIREAITFCLAVVLQRFRERDELRLFEFTFMSNLHLVMPTADPEASVRRLNRMCGQLARTLGLRFVARVAEPEPAVPLAVIARAAAAAHRVRPEAVRTRGNVRRDFVYVVHEQGWTDADRVALACGCTPHGIRKLRRQPQPPNLDAAPLPRRPPAPPPPVHPA